MTIRIGTRASKLARWQAEWVATKLKSYGVETEVVYLTTVGDVESRPIGAIGSEGVFTREIQRALLDGSVDLAVHSLKDLPTMAVPGLHLAAVPERERNGDALVSSQYSSIDELPPSAKIGTGSARRKAQLLAYRADLQVEQIRGNVDTRLKKLHDGEFDAIILAEAGLHRLGLEHEISQVLPKSLMLPAVGQGALGLETRADDPTTRESVQCLHHEESYQAVLCERALLRSVQGGCLAPIGAWARVEADAVILDAVVLAENGQAKLSASGTAAVHDGEKLGEQVAQKLLGEGAAQILSAARH